MAEHFVIVGNGPAGFRAAKAIRQHDGDVRISIFTRERHPFYLRRQLGDLLAGEASPTELVFQTRNTYRRERIDLFLDTHVERLAPDVHEVVLASGERVRYDRLLIATGTEADPAPLAGLSLHGVVRFDTLARATLAREALAEVRRAVVLDEGLVGLVMAEGLTRAGIEATCLLRGERYWPSMFDEESSTAIEGLLEDQGVTLRRETAPRAIVGANQTAIGVEVADGSVVAAEMVGYGSRRRPALGPLEDSGVEVGRGIRVDERFRTNRRDIFAAGDATEPFPQAAGGTTAGPGPTVASSGVPRECPFCWQRAWAQGNLAGLAMMDRAFDRPADTIRTRTTVFGRELAVLGQGHVAEGGDVEALEVRDTLNVYRRLVFRQGILIGATVLGTGEGVLELNRMVAEGASREAVEAALGRAPTGRTVEHLPVTFAQHCPICAAELVIYRGTRLGATVVCRACSTDLVVRWNGERGWLDVIHP